MFAGVESGGREVGASSQIYEARFYASSAQVAQGHLDVSARYTYECLQWSHKAGARREIVCTLIQMADQASRLGDLTRASRLLGAVRELEKDLNPMSGASVSNFFRHWHLAAQRTIIEPTLAAARAELGDTTFETAYASGQQMTLDRAVEYALSA